LGTLGISHNFFDDDLLVDRAIYYY